MEWRGIERDSAITGAGAYLSVGCDMMVEGELRRRVGMATGVTQSGTAMIGVWNPYTGRFAVFATSTGTVVSVAV